MPWKDCSVMDEMDERMQFVARRLADAAIFSYASDFPILLQSGVRSSQ